MEVEQRAGGRVLIVGASGYMGKRLARASLQEGHPTFLLLRPDVSCDLHKAQLFLSLKRAGARFLKGSIEDFGSLVAAIKQVDIVVSAMGEDRLLDQLKLIHAMKEAGNVKRFLPSEYGMDPDHFCTTPIELFAHKREVRRAVEKAKIPFTYVSANCLAGYFLSGLGQYGQFMPPSDHVLIYGDGNQKVIWVKEEDVATYAIKTIEDPRTMNKTIYIRPPLNILSQNEVVAIWENLQGSPLQKSYVNEEAWIQEMKDADSPRKTIMNFFQLIFFQGKTYNIDIDVNAKEASTLYPNFKYESIHEYLYSFT